MAGRRWQSIGVDKCRLICMDNLLMQWRDENGNRISLSLCFCYFKLWKNA